MTNRLLVCSLDALDEYNIHMLNLNNLQDIYKKAGDIFTCATLPHTAVSNPMIFGGIENESRFWVEREDSKTGQETGAYLDPSQYFDRDKGTPVKGARGFSRQQDYAEESFIWDDLYATGIDARAVQVPISLPPYSFRASETLQDSWFPDKKKRMAKHIRKKPNLLKEQFEDGADVVCSSIQMPDKWLHAIGEGKASEEWVLKEAPVLDKKIKELISYCESEGIEWCFFGDHGSPYPGAMKKNGYVLPRHRKESIIISSKNLNPPTYTDELYNWMKKYYNVSSVDSDWDKKSNSENKIDEDVSQRLENLGYL